MISPLKIICGTTLPVLLLAGCAVNQENSSPAQSAQISDASNAILRASQISQPAELGQGSCYGDSCGYQP